MLSKWLLLLYLSAVATAGTLQGHVVHEERDGPPARWRKRSRVHQDSILPVRIGLKQSNLDRAHQMLMDVSHPDSPNFAKHWTSEEVRDFFKPSDEAVRAVREWLVSAGFPKVSLSENKAWLAFNARASQVEQLLHAEFFEYEHNETSTIQPSCDRYHVPEEIQPHIDYITPGLKLLSPHGPTDESRNKSLRRRRVQAHDAKVSSPKPGAANLASCKDLVTPECIAALYQIPPVTLEPSPDNVMGIYESFLTSWDQQDLNDFFSTYTNIPNGTHPRTNSIDGGISRNNTVSYDHNAGHGHVEANLDLQLVYPIIYPQSIVIWSENDLHYQGSPNDTNTFGFNQMLDSMDGSYCTYSAYGETGDAPGIDPHYPDPTPHTGYDHPLECGVFKPTTVIALSFVGQEDDVPIAYQKRQCNEFLKLGLQGVSFVFGAGDTGVAGDQFEGPACIGKNASAFNPTWPGTCPYVTVVGATRLGNGNGNGVDPKPESVAAFPGFFASGGGFSNIYPIPSYQRSEVERYLTHHNPPYESYSALAQNAPNPATVNVSALQGSGTGLYNRIGRGYPDVTAIGDNIATFINGQPAQLAGTSASAQIFAAIINRINEERLAIGKKSLGFLNPALYANPSMFDDVKSGSNIGCNTNGFNATEGWDPASGLGTPNYIRMRNYLKKLP